MSDANIKRQIKLLLEHSIYEVPYDLTKGSLKIKQAELDVYNDLQPEGWVLDHRQILAIKSLFEQSSKNSRKVIVDELVTYLDSGIVSVTSLKTLVYLGQSEIIINKCLVAFKAYTQGQFIVLFNTLTFLIAYQSNLFTNLQLNSIYDWLEEYFKGANEVGKERRRWSTLYSKFDSPLSSLLILVTKLLSEKVIRDIYSSFNPEINQDEKRLIEEFSRYGFPKDLVETLDKIDSKLSNANDGFDYKNCIDLMRSFSERLYQSIAIEVDHVKGGKLRVQDSEEVAKFFVSSSLLSSGQAEFLISSRHFLSNEGSHKLKSPPEECRLSRNILIEFSLFLFGRLKQLKSKPSISR